MADECLMEVVTRATVAACAPHSGINVASWGLIDARGCNLTRPITVLKVQGEDVDDALL